MRKLLRILCLIVSLTAIPSGIIMILYPEGSVFQLPPDLLQFTPFENFLIPGLLLAIVVGGSALTAGIALFSNSPLQYSLAMIAGILLDAWIFIQTLLLRSFHWLHGFYLFLGLAILVLASWLINHDSRSWMDNAIK